MALPNYWKLHCYNDTGVTLDLDGVDNLVVTGIPWKRDSDGALSYGSKVTLLDPSADIADGAMAEGTEQDNTSNKWEGMFCYVLCSAESTNPDGNILFYMEWGEGDEATDTYPSDATDFDAARMDTDLILVGKITPEGDGDDVVAACFEI